MQTDSEELLHRGVDVAATTWAGLCEELGWDHATPQLACTHQVGVAHRKLLVERLGLEVPQIPSSFEYLGNCGSASLPATASIAVQQTPPAKGDNVAFLGIGSGINCLMLGIEW